MIYEYHSDFVMGPGYYRPMHVALKDVPEFGPYGKIVFCEHPHTCLECRKNKKIIHILSNGNLREASLGGR